MHSIFLPASDLPVPLTSAANTLCIQRSEVDFFAGEPLRALSTLVYSDNVDLQRSASLTFAEITERGDKLHFRPFPTMDLGH